MVYTTNLLIGAAQHLLAWDIFSISRGMWGNLIHGVALIQHCFEQSEKSNSCDYRAQKIPCNLSYKVCTLVMKLLYCTSGPLQLRLRKEENLNGSGLD